MGRKKTGSSPCDVCLDKDSKKCKKCENGTSRALALRDAEALARQSKLAELRFDLPYNRDSYISQVRFLLKQTAESILAIGRMLLVIKEEEGHGNFQKIIVEEIGLGIESARRFMNAALKAEKYPSIEFQRFEKVSTVYALLEAPEEVLQELDEKGVLAGANEEDLYSMPHKQMVALLKKLQSDVAAVVKEETKALQTEKKALIKELDRLRAFDPENRGGDLSWCEEQYEAVAGMLDEVDTAIRKIAFDERLHEAPDIQAKILGIIERMKARVQDISDDFDAFIAEGAEAE